MQPTIIFNNQPIPQHYHNVPHQNMVQMAPQYTQQASQNSLSKSHNYVAHIQPSKFVASYVIDYNR